MDRAGCSTACTVFRKVSHEEWCAKPDSAHQKIQILSWCSRRFTRGESTLTVAHSIQHYIQPGTVEPCPHPGHPLIRACTHYCAAPRPPRGAGKKVQTAGRLAAPAAGLRPCSIATHQACSRQAQEVRAHRGSCEPTQGGSRWLAAVRHAQASAASIFLLHAAQRALAKMQEKSLSSMTRTGFQGVRLDQAMCSWCAEPDSNRHGVATVRT